MNYTDQNGQPVALGARLGSGGEADVYAANGQPGVVAKIYKADKIVKTSDAERTAKLRAMVANPPADPTAASGHVSICWPQSLIFQGPTCVGFLMHLVDFKTAVPLLRLYNPLDRQQVTTSFTWQYLLRTAVNIASAMESIHACGYVIGDINESNILATNQALVTWVDCDSMQVYDAAAKRYYRCPVGKAEFTPPELQGMNFGTVDRTTQHDDFGLGILIFMLLMEGIHPFINGVWTGAGDPPSIEDRIRHGFSPYAASFQVKPMPAAPPFSILPIEARLLVERCFKDGHTDPFARPTPGEWLNCLRSIETSLRTCDQSRFHVFSAHLTDCPWCERTQLLGQDPFPAVAAPSPAAKPAVLKPAPQAPLQATAFQSSPSVKLSSSLSAPPAKRSYVRKLAVGIAAAVAGLAAVTFGWHGFNAASSLKDPAETVQTIVPAPAAAETSKGKSVVASSSTANGIHVEPIVLSRGVDANKTPVGAATSFSEWDFQNRRLTVSAHYQNPNKRPSTFQVRWHIAGQTVNAGPYDLPPGNDTLALDYAGKVPVGQHWVEVLANGISLQKASFVVTAEVPINSTAPQNVTSVPETVTTALPVATALPPASANTNAATHSYAAKHKHKLGGCNGTLVLTADSIAFTGGEHSFKYLRSEVAADHDGISDGVDKKWRFSIQGTDVTRLLFLWKERGAVTY